MKDELSQAELDEIFYGKAPTVVARFYDKEVLDCTASREQGHRIMKVARYIELSCEKESTYINRPMQKDDMRLYPSQWHAYQEEKEHERHRQISDLRAEGVCEPQVNGGYLKAQGG